MSYIASLPRDLLFLIAYFLLPKEEQNKVVFRYSFAWRNFINTSKQSFGEWKKHTQVIVLEWGYARDFFRSPEFSRRILLLIENSRHQLELKIRRMKKLEERELGWMNKVKCFDVAGCNLPFPQASSHLALYSCQIDQFPNNSVISKLNMVECKIGPKNKNSNQETVDLKTLTVVEEAFLSSMKLQNYQSLSSLLKSVTIKDCDSLTDVSCFRHLPKVKFENCPNITDVSCLDDVRELSLRRCAGICDVSSLGRVYNLDLSICRNISDVSALGNVHILNLERCTGVTDFSTLKNVYELHVGGLPDWVREPRKTSLVGLENVEKLFLHTSIIMNNDLSMLTKVKELHFIFCTGITDFHGLNLLKKLRVGATVENIYPSYNNSGPLLITDGLDTFENLLELEASSINFVEDERDPNDSNHYLSLSDVPNVQILTLECCVFIQFPTTFTHLLSLKLNDCRCCSVLYLPGFPALDSLEINRCELAELHFLGNDAKFPICNVKIDDCEKLTKIHVFREISLMKVSKCRKLVRIFAESQINYLRLKTCPILTVQGAVKPILTSYLD
jgi:hypothetical protein